MPGLECLSLQESQSYSTHLFELEAYIKIQRDLTFRFNTFSIFPFVCRSELQQCQNQLMHALLSHITGMISLNSFYNAGVSVTARSLIGDSIIIWVVRFGSGVEVERIRWCRLRELFRFSLHQLQV